MQGRFGMGGYPYDRHWIHRFMWSALAHAIGWLSYVIGNERAGALDVWRVEGDVTWREIFTGRLEMRP